MSRTRILALVVIAAGGAAAAAFQFIAPRKTSRIHVGPTGPISQAEGARLVALADSIGTAGLLVIKDGQEILAWGDVDVPREIRSMRKSVNNLILGRLVLAGRLDLGSTLEELGVDDDGFALNETEKQATVAQLMEARSGVYHPSTYETRSAGRNRPDRGAHAPGQFFYYNNWDFNVLESIAATAAGHGDFCQTFAEYAAPLLGVSEPTKSCRIELDKDLSQHAAHPLRLSARNLARLAEIYLNDGRAGGDRVVPDGWVQWSVEPYSDPPGNEDSKFHYGRLFWAIDPYGPLSENSYMARGSGGQYLWVMPEQGLVVVHVVKTWPLYVRYRLGLIPEDAAAHRLGGLVASAVVDDRMEAPLLF